MLDLGRFPYIATDYDPRFDGTITLLDRNLEEKNFNLEDFDELRIGETVVSLDVMNAWLAGNVDEEGVFIEVYVDVTEDNVLVVKADLEGSVELEDGTVAVFTQEQLQAAIDDAVAGNNVIKVFPGDYGTEAIEIIQQEGVNITLEAVGEVVLKNQIKIDGQNRYGGVESLTIKGFTFDFTDATGAVDIISAVKNEIESTNNYAHNITIENNVFKGNPGVNVVAIRTNGVFGLEINSSQGIGLHSLGQIQGQSKYFRVIDTTVEAGESGINYYGPADVEITGLTVEGTNYGVRAGQGSGTVKESTLTISDSNLNAQYPIWLRGDAPGTVIITDSTLEPTGDGPMIYDVTNEPVEITIDGETYSVPE